MNEAETRAEHIDPALKAAGWGVVEGSRIRREYLISPGRIEGHGRRGKPLTADYVLIYRNTKLAVVEAKAWDEPLTEGVGQAKNYADKLAVRFTYATNGQGIYGIDMEEGTEREIRELSDSGRALESHYSHAERCMARSLRFYPASRTRAGIYGRSVLPGYRDRACDGGHRGRQEAHSPDPGHRHRQDLDRLPDRLEALP